MNPALRFLKLGIACSTFLLSSGIIVVWATPILDGKAAPSAGGLSSWTNTGNTVPAGPGNRVDFRYTAPAWASPPAELVFHDQDEGPGQESLFPVDLQDIERIGSYVAVQPGTGAGSAAGVDNSNIVISEPEDIFLLATVLLALGFSLRHRLHATARTYSIGPS